MSLKAARTPNATAVIFPRAGADEELTYRELDQRANQLARYLRAQGVEPGSLAGLCIERSADMVVALIAILKAGAAYVPLDPSYPTDRLEYMLSDAGVDVVVSTSELAGLLPSVTKLVHLDEVREEIEALDAGPLDSGPGGIGSDALMYVIYTSGSTGRPKGVEVEHRSASNILSCVSKEPGFEAGERLLAVSTLSFDISMAELLLPLVVGGTVVVAPQEATADGRRLMELLATYRPAVLQATPATWRLLLLSGWEGDPNLRIFATGEALPRELADELLDRGAELWNLYGPTEATIWAAIHRVRREEGPMLIGRPVQSSQLYVVDEHMEPVPIGVVGELYIGGDCLARGYHARPELTAERFLPNPFVDDENARIYRSGDLARWLPRREIECLGRIDNQIKLRGFRIELGEIESILADVEGVHQCVTVVREDEPGDQRLTAYFVTAGDGQGDVSVSELRERARQKLPSYMVPSAFVRLETLPHTPNGKVDRLALVGMQSVEPVFDTEYVAPRTEMERRIVEIWKDVLRIEQVSVHMNFFDMGGHSLLLAEMHLKLQDALGVDPTIIELFQFPTVSSLATHLGDPDRRESLRSQRGRNLAVGRQALMRRRIRR